MLGGVTVAAINKTLVNDIVEGVFESSILAVGVTKSDGHLNIVEPETKNYYNRDDRLTSSIVIQNKVMLSAWHKWWVPDTKLLIAFDSRGCVGRNPGRSYKGNDVCFLARKAGYNFYEDTRPLQAPYEPTITLEADTNYPDYPLVTNDISLTYEKATRITRVTLPGRDLTLDELYKAIVDFHTDKERTEVNSVLPVLQSTPGVFTLRSADILLRITAPNAETRVLTGKLLKYVTAPARLSDSFKAVLYTLYLDADVMGYADIEGAERDTVSLVSVSTGEVLSTRIGDGAIGVGSSIIGTEVYAVRNAHGVVIASSRNTPFVIKDGYNGVIPLYAGSQVQVADINQVKDNLTILNRGIQNASLLIPHTEELV